MEIMPRPAVIAAIMAITLFCGINRPTFVSVLSFHSKGGLYEACMYHGVWYENGQCCSASIGVVCEAGAVTVPFECHISTCSRSSSGARGHLHEDTTSRLNAFSRPADEE